MKIAQVTLGHIKIPPNGWGAIEKLIWYYKVFLEKLGHTVDIVSIDSPLDSYDIVHVHAANHALMLSERNIPYIFSMNDHHTYIWGKWSSCYLQNLEAINKSMASFVSGEFLLSYFDYPKNLLYLPNTVDCNFFTPPIFRSKALSFLCVGNNGIINEEFRDRKGFRYAIELARTLDANITVAGPEKNLSIIQSWGPLYHKLSFIKEPNEDELCNLYRSHSIFLHFSEIEAGHPNLTLLESLSCGLPIIGTYNGSVELKGMEVINEKNINKARKAVENITFNYDQYSDNARKTAQLFDCPLIVNQLQQVYLNILENHGKPTLSLINGEKVFKERVFFSYQDLQFNDSPPLFNLHFVNGPHLNIRNNTEGLLSVEFKNKETDETLLQKSVLNGTITYPKTFYIPYSIKIKDKTGAELYNYDLDYNNQKVHIHLDSKSLGDTIAWFPYVEEFRIKHNCQMVCSTFWNDLFVNDYKHIQFVKPGANIDGILGMYEVGVFENDDRNLRDYRTIPLQQLSSDTLGLEYKEIKPKISIDNNYKIKTPENYVCISSFSTSKAKEWNNPNGWRELVDYLKTRGLDVVHLDKDKERKEKGIINISNKLIQEIIHWILDCKYFVGIGSGLSWLAWALNKKVVLISGFSKPYTEFQDCIRVHNPDVCNGCFNDPSIRYDRGDWEWCPRKKDFECTKRLIL